VTPVIRAWAGVLAVAGASLAYNLAFLAEVVRRAPGAGYVDRVTRAERRYDPVRDALPQRGTVGYELKVRSPAMLEWYKFYGLFFAQYTLPPLQVEKANGQEVVIEEYDEGVRVARRPK